MLVDALDSKDKQKIEKVFERIYDTYHGLISYCLCQYIKTPEDIEEVLNDVFINFFNRLNSIEIKSIKYYLVTSAKSKALDLIKKNKKNDHIPLDDNIAAIENDNNKFWILYDEIKQYLSTEDFYIFEEYVINDKASIEIARTLNTSAGNIRTRIHRILKRIKTHYGG